MIFQSVMLNRAHNVQQLIRVFSATNARITDKQNTVLVVPFSQGQGDR